MRNVERRGFIEDMKIKRIVLPMALIVLVVAMIMLGGCGTTADGDDNVIPLPGLGTKPNENPKPGITLYETLDTPEITSYSSQTYTLCWTPIANASGYTIYYNGNELEVDAEDAEEQIVVTAEENTFKVKANGDQKDYTDSEWSEEYTYTIEQQSIFNKVNLAIGEYAKQKGYELIDIIGISYANVEGNYLGEQVYIECVCKEGNINQNVTFVLKTDVDTSIEDVLSEFSIEELWQEAKTATVDYDSAEYLLKSGAYDGNMQQLKNEGYEISVVNSCVREGAEVGSKFRFEIVGTYKAARGDEVLYFTSINRIDVLKPSSDPELNYEEILRYKNYRNVTETSFVLHENGQTWEYMKDWVKAYDNTDTQE